MKRRGLAFALALVGCPLPFGEAPPEIEVADPDARPDLSFTDWHGNSELFLELPALVRGVDSPCAAHVTRLAPFSALADGRVTVILRRADDDAGGESKAERFSSEAPSTAGIFRPVARPSRVGPHRLLVEVAADGLSETHDLGEVMVYDTALDARASILEEPEAPGRIVFLKEQQWVIDFATAPVREHPLRPTLRVTGRIVPRADGEIEVTAPVAGRIASRAGLFPRLGDRVALDDVLGVLAPRLEATDLASLDLAVTSSTLELRFAQRERERLEALRREGAVPERRVVDAMHAEEEASAALGAAQRRLGQFRRVQRTAGKGEGSVSLRAPMSGTITAIDVAPGAFVEAGAPVLHVADLTRVWLEARVPEVDAARVMTPRGASVEVEGHDAPLELGPDALVVRGSVIDPDDRTLHVVFAVDNAEARLPIGAFARVALVLGDERTALAVPESALVDDGGTMVVYVQAEGEAFERRVVRTGLADRGVVEVLSGIAAGEHVVTTGAWSVKLAASSGTLPAHGHAH